MRKMRTSQLIVEPMKMGLWIILEKLIFILVITTMLIPPSPSLLHVQAVLYLAHVVLLY